MDKKAVHYIYTMEFSVQFSHSVMSNSLRPHNWQHARPPCPSPTPGVHSDSCPSTDEWIKKLWNIYTMVYYSAIRRNKFQSVVVRWMNLEPVIQNEVSQKETNIIY